MPFLLFFKLGAVRARDVRLGEEEKKGGGCVGVWVFSNIRMCGCLCITDYGLHLIARTQAQ